MVTDKNCTNCGASFKCGATGADNSCWCAALPNIVPMTEGAECLCPACLTAKIKKMEGTGKELILPANIER